MRFERPIRVYVASSYKNELQPVVVGWLRRAGALVFDFRHPPPGGRPFEGRTIDHDGPMRGAEFVDTVNTRRAMQGFMSNMGPLAAADVLVLLQPCGASAHLEAGFAIGSGIPVLVAIPHDGLRSPELMLMAANAMFVLSEDLAEAETPLLQAIASIMSQRDKAERQVRLGLWQRHGTDVFEMEIAHRAAITGKN